MSDGCIACDIGQAPLRPKPSRRDGGWITESEWIEVMESIIDGSAYEEHQRIVTGGERSDRGLRSSDRKSRRSGKVEREMTGTRKGDTLKRGDDRKSRRKHREPGAPKKGLG